MSPVQTVSVPIKVSPVHPRVKRAWKFWHRHFILAQRRCLHKFQLQKQVFIALNPYRPEYLEIKRIDRTTNQRRFFKLWHDLASFRVKYSKQPLNRLSIQYN